MGVRAPATITDRVMSGVYGPPSAALPLTPGMRASMRDAKPSVGPAVKYLLRQAGGAGGSSIETEPSVALR